MSPAEPLRVAYLTAGAAGMICGNCLHDNTLARALRQQGIDIQLLPTYTPIRTDEPDASVPRVFLGGVNVYLNARVPGYRWLPRWLTHWLDSPALIRRFTAGGASINARQLGPLTLSMLRGEAGGQQRELAELAQYLADEARPHLVVLSNVLIGGCIPAIKRATGARVLVTLQGDDTFLASLPENFRAAALAEIQKLSRQVDGFLTNSQFYANYMACFLGINRASIHQVPLGIETSDLGQLAAARPSNFTLGYLARLAPEKGLHVLVDAFLALRRRPEFSGTRLHVAGWLGPQHAGYWREQQEKLQQAGAWEHVRYFGEVDRAGKLDFLRSLSLLSVPTVHPEPKGLFALEALAAGVPVVVPEAGAFPELLAATGGGLMFPPGNTAALVNRLAELAQESLRAQLAQEGRAAVLAHRSAPHMASETLAVWRRLLGPETSAPPAP